MSIKKTFFKHHPVCQVTFKLPKEMVQDATQVCLVGEFNEWNPSVNPMRPLKNGAFTKTLKLEKGKEYEFRYLIGGGIWENDPEADRYAPSPYGGVMNSVVDTHQMKVNRA